VTEAPLADPREAAEQTSLAPLALERDHLVLQPFDLST
jgi:hypothetical protein